MATKTKKSPAFASLSERVKSFSDKDIQELDAIRLGDPYSEETANRLFSAGLVHWVGGEAFINETGRRVLTLKSL
jgi:hypothetical protein